MQQRRGFLDGESTCYKHDLRHSWDRKYPNNYIGRQLVDEYYSGTGNLDLLVTEVLKVIKDVRRPRLDGGQAHPEKYGYRDGTYWRLRSKEANLGFLQGYISCLPDSKQLYPKAPEYYRQRIDQWYQHDDWAREEEKVPNVLRKFAETQ